MPNEGGATPMCVPDTDRRCSACADEGVVAQVLRVDADASARVMIGAEEQVVALDLVDGVHAGDSILIHLGFAIARLGDT